MSITISRGTSDTVINEIKSALSKYEIDHPKALIALYRYNPGSVRLRVIDPGFKGQGMQARNERIWKYLGNLNEDTQADISTIVLITPDEMKSSLANFEFEEPSPSML